MHVCCGFLKERFLFRNVRLTHLWAIKIGGSPNRTLNNRDIITAVITRILVDAENSKITAHNISISAIFKGYRLYRCYFSELNI